MYILKNALRCISRSKGRNILIGIITLVIAVSACLGLSIRQAAESAKEETLAGMTVTATISFDRQSMMNDMDFSKGEQDGGFDRTEFADMMTSGSTLSLEEYKTYATAESVKDFYYTVSTSFNGTDDFEAVTTETSEEESGEDLQNNGEFPDFDADGDKMFGGGKMNNMMGMQFSSGDFTVIGYSSEVAMTEFQSGVATVSDGTVFDECTENYECIISEELAIFNSVDVGSTITLTNPDNEEESYELTIVGIYTSSQSNDATISMFSTSQDPANRIYMSANALQNIIDISSGETVEEESETGLTKTDESDEDETSSIAGTISATYLFEDAAAYERFEDEARALGLDDSYTVSSTDISAYESSLTPLNTLSTMAGWFLIVILIIGAIILIVLNIFNVRERKYQIGVLTAMGMKKSKVALQFIAEILIVTMIAVVLGACIGAVSSVPVTNALLENQVSSQESQFEQIENNFGRGEMPDMLDNAENGNNPMGGGMNFMEEFGNNAAEYITKVDSAMNLTVVIQMLGIGLLLTLIASAFSVLFVMRYDPLKILANRD
ncbi:MAG: ABC transporter permease [Clostridia bacterium]|nr:ABC transporter permease [Clostridia bacterium]